MFVHAADSAVASPPLLNMYLYLNTTERDSFEVALIDERGIVKRKKVKSARRHSEKLLRTINDLLNSRERGLAGIAVVKGPGSFTSLRIGISTANALAYALAVPVVGVKPDFPLEKLADLFNKPSKKGIVLPTYGGEPNITLPNLGGMNETS